MYVKGIAILLLLSGLIAGCWKLYDAGGDAREAEVRLEFATEKQIQSEVRERLRAKAEANIQASRVIYRDRIQKIREVVTDCTLPADLIGLLRESGVFKAR